MESTVSWGQRIGLYKICTRYIVQNMCQHETFHHRGQGDTIKKAPKWFLDREVVLLKSVACVAGAGPFFGWLL